MNVFLGKLQWREYEELPIAATRLGRESHEPTILTKRRTAFLRSRRVQPFAHYF